MGTLQEYDSFRENYELIHPRPGKPGIKLPFDEWRFWVFGIVAMFAPLVSGFRTYAAFERVAVGGFVEGLLGVIAVEVGLIGYQIERIQRLAQAGQLKTVGEGMLKLGVGITLLVALVANLDIVLGNSGVVVPYRNIAIGITVGGLVPLLGLIAGEVLGRLFHEVDETNKANAAEYQIRLAEWEEKLGAAWGRQLRRRDIDATGVAPEKKERQVSPTLDDYDAFVSLMSRVNGDGPKTPGDLSRRYSVNLRTSQRWFKKLSQTKESTSGN